MMRSASDETVFLSGRQLAAETVRIAESRITIVMRNTIPDSISGRQFYIPSDNGYERKIKDWMEKIRKEADLAEKE